VLLPECSRWSSEVPRRGGRCCAAEPNGAPLRFPSVSSGLPQPPCVGHVWLTALLRCRTNRSPLPLPECLHLPPAVPGRGLTVTPRSTTCTPRDSVCPTVPAVCGSVMHGRVCWGAAEPTRVPLPPPECPRWLSTAPEHGLLDVPRVIACVPGDPLCSPESSVFDSVIHEEVRCGTAEPTGICPSVSQMAQWAV
jgi:hypothetical protein